MLISVGISAVSFIVNVVLYRNLRSYQRPCRFCSPVVMNVHEEGCGHPDNPSNTEDKE